MNMIITEGNRFVEEVDAVRRHGAVKPAADELGIDSKTLKSRVKRAGYKIEAFLVPGTQGKNMTIVRTMLDGNMVRVGKPIPEQISIDDIARGLARIGWNQGQTLGYFSLAYVSCHFAEHIAKELKSPEAAMASLFWLAPAAYMGDVPTFLMKRLHGNYGPLRQQMLTTILAAFDLKAGLAEFEEAIAMEWTSFEKKVDGTLCRGTGELSFTKPSSTRGDEVLFKRNWETLQAVREMVRTED